MALTFPFLFYGAHPADWYEGANDGHLYEVAFASPPDDRTRVAIADAFERVLARGAASPARAPWAWSGRFALLRVGERWLSAGHAAFRSVSATLRRIHAFAPIDQAVFCGTRDAGADPWTAWSRQQRPRALAGPAYANLTPDAVFRRGPDPKLATATVNDAFEAARRATRSALASADAKAKAAPVAPGEIGVVPVDGPEPEPGFPDEIVQRFPDDAVVFEALGRPFAFVEVDGWRSGLQFLEGDRVVSVHLRPAARSLAHVATSHDGTTAYVGSEEGNLYAVSLPGGKARSVYKSDNGSQGTPRGLACMRDGRVLLLTNENLYLLAPRGDGLTVVTSVRAPSAFRLVQVSDGLYVAGTLASKKTRVYVFGVHGDDLRVLAKLTLPLNPYSLVAEGGRAFGDVDDAHQTYEIVHLGEAFDAAFRPKAPGASDEKAKTKAKTRKAGPIKLRAQKPARILWMELTRAGVDDVACCELDESGSLVGLAPVGDGYRVVRADRELRLSHVDLPAGDFGLSAREDGAVALAYGAPGLFEVDLATMRLTKLATDVQAEHAAYVGQDVVLVEERAVVLCARDGARLVERSRVEIGKVPFGVGTRKNVVVVPTDEKDKTPVFVVADGELRPAGYVKEQVNVAVGCGPLLLLCGPKGTYELDARTVAENA